MLASFSEFKFYKSFRIPVEKADDVRFLVEMDDEMTGKEDYIDDAKLVDISVTGLGFSTRERLSVGKELSVSLHYKKIHLDLSCYVVRAFTSTEGEDAIIYGIEFEEEDIRDVKKFLETYINGFSPDRLKDCLVGSALGERYASATDGFEMFSLLLSIFKDLTSYADRENFVDTLLEEVSRVLNAQKAILYLINPDTNELEATSSRGVDKEKVHFDYRQGIAGSVFTSGVSLNINTEEDCLRLDESIEEVLGAKPKCMIAHPVHNREDKTIGVLQVINKRNEPQFNVEDEKTMKILSLVFSSIFHNYNPLSEKSQVRRFSRPFDREYVMVGKSPIMGSIRGAIVKMKDISTPLLIHGEHGVGKSLLSKIIHVEGKRGLNPYTVVHCGSYSNEEFKDKIFGTDGEEGVLTASTGGTVFLHEVWHVQLEVQDRLHKILSQQRTEKGESFDIRIVCSSTKDIDELVAQGKFHKELFEWISSAYVHIDPLRRRRGDIKDLVNYFLKVECKKQGLLLKAFTQNALESFMQYDWPGNVGELRKCVERAVLYNPKGHVIGDLSNSATPLFDKTKSTLKMFDDIPFVSDFQIPLKDRVALAERQMILAEIKRNNGNKSKASKEMGISREALRKKLLQSEKVIVSLKENKIDLKKAA